MSRCRPRPGRSGTIWPPAGCSSRSAAAFAVGASRYELGTALNMGPGYLPLVLGLVLVTLGLVIVGQGVTVRVRAMRAADPAAPADLASGSAATDRQAAGSAATDQPAAASPAAGTAVAVEPPEPTRGPVPWLRGALLVAAVLVFGLTVQGAGLVPALFLTSFLAALAGYRTGPIRAARDRGRADHRLRARVRLRPAAPAAPAGHLVRRGSRWTFPASPSAWRPRSSWRTSWSA